MRRIVIFLKEQKNYLISAVVILMMISIIAFIYRLPSEVIFYLLSATLIIVIAYLVVEYHKQQSKIKKIKKQFKQYNYIDNEINDDSIDQLYHNIIEELFNNYQQHNMLIDHRYEEWKDMLTLWLHQIKLPISALSLMIDNEEKNKTMIKSELLRIEQYSSMVMAILRTENTTNDFVFDSIDLNDLIKKVIKTFKYEFIRKKLQVNYIEHTYMVVSDKKALQFILEQLISNALKYTDQGSITITIEDNAIKIKDTGIGIASSDLPRIFEKSYSGINGHETNKASGMGLYLSKKMADLIDAEIIIDSVIDKGTTAQIKFKTKITEM